MVFCDLLLNLFRLKWNISQVALPGEVAVFSFKILQDEVERTLAWSYDFLESLPVNISMKLVV